MTKETAKNVAKHNTNEEVNKWSLNVAKFGVEAHAPILRASKKTCAECPFRNKGAMGGCIGEDCPVNAVLKAVRLTMKRSATGAREVFKAKYKEI